MNNKGFTLIEIIAIVLILVVIFLVSFPTLTNMAKQNDEKKYDNMVNDLCTAGKTYIYSNIDEYENLSNIGVVIDVKISDLTLYGSVDKNLINPKTETTTEKDKLVYTVLEDFSLECKYIEG